MGHPVSWHDLGVVRVEVVPSQVSESRPGAASIFRTYGGQGPTIGARLGGPMAFANWSPSRSLYILAGALGFFAVAAGGMSFLPSHLQPGLPANASLWRMAALLLLLGALGSALAGVMTNLFEQVDRRGEERRLAAKRKRRGAKP